MNLQAYLECPKETVEKIEQHVQCKTNGMIRELRVEFVEGEVIVTGRTRTYYAKQLATHAILSALQDAIVANEIEVC